MTGGTGSMIGAGVPHREIEEQRSEATARDLIWFGFLPLRST